MQVASAPTGTVGAIKFVMPGKGGDGCGAQTASTKREASPIKLLQSHPMRVGAVCGDGI